MYRVRAGGDGIVGSFVFSLASFIVAIGVLVTVHEYGHFWVARRLGVKVLRFSVGFGRPLWRRTFGQDSTELVIAAIPLGGYVKMLDERDNGCPCAGTTPIHLRNRCWHPLTVCHSHFPVYWGLILLLYFVIILSLSTVCLYGINPSLNAT